MAFQPPDPGSSTDTSHWPPGVGSITWNDIGRLGVGPDNRLYWDGRPVVVERRLVLSLPQPQKIWAAVFAFAALLAAIGTVAQGWAAGHDWLCKVGLVVTWCQR